jgi:hypothetical protein
MLVTHLYLDLVSPNLRLFYWRHLESASCRVIAHKASGQSCLAIEHDNYRESIIVRIVDLWMLYHSLLIENCSDRRFNWASTKLWGVGIRVGNLFQVDADIERCHQVGVQVPGKLNVIRSNKLKVTCHYWKAQIAQVWRDEAWESVGEDPLKLIVQSIIDAAICGPPEGFEEIALKYRILSLYLVSYRLGWLIACRDSTLRALVDVVADDDLRHQDAWVYKNTFGQAKSSESLHDSDVVVTQICLYYLIGINLEVLNWRVVMKNEAGFLENSLVLTYEGSRGPDVILTILRASHVL